MSNINFTGQKKFFMARYLYEVLCEKEIDIKNPEFLHTWEEYKDIDIAKHLDFLLFPEIEEIVEKYNVLSLYVLWKDDFKDLEIGDVIEDKTIVFQGFFTIWLIENKEFEAKEKESI